MTVRRPVGFILASHAAACDPNMVSYEQLWQEVQAGSIVIDPNLSHEGEWLLDYAIKMRLASHGGLRAFRAHRGADPAMDALWARWLLAAGPSRLGDEVMQAERAAFLIRAGSSLCLEAALAKGVSAEMVRERWEAQQPGALHVDPLVHCAREDLLPTVTVLARQGFCHQASFKGKHPLLAAKSADMLALLLDVGLDPTQLQSPGLIDRLLSQSIAAPELAKMIDLLNSRRGMESSPEDHVRRMATNLEKKSLEQLRVEMRSAGWSPARRNGLPSPIVAWSRSKLEKCAVHAECSPALEWLGKQSSVQKPQPGEDWSEACWIWAGLFAKNPRIAEPFARLACDMPHARNSAERVRFFHEFTQSNGFPRQVEDAISAQFGDMPWHDADAKTQIARDKLDCWLGGGDASFLSLYTAPANHDPDPVSWFSLFQGNDCEKQRAQCMTIACWLAVVQGSPRLTQQVEALWHAGARPMETPSIVQAFSRLVEGRAGGFSAQVEGWALDKASHMATTDRPKPRL